VGAASLVGEAIIKELRARKFPIAHLHRLEELRDIGRIADADPEADDAPGEANVIGDVANFDFSRSELTFFCGRAELSRRYAPVAAQHGWAIDASSAFREQADIPLVVADVNAHRLPTGARRGMVALPGSASVALTTALAPLHALGGLTRLDVASYHAVSGTGRGALEELARDTASLLNGRQLDSRRGAPRIAFNVIPQVDAIDADGVSREERRMLAETRRVLDSPQLAVNVTAVRVPVFFGHSLSVHAAFEAAMDVTTVLAALRGAGPAVRLMEGLPGLAYPTPATEAMAPDRVYVGRVRQDVTRPNGINLWIVADNVRKCAAFNAISVAQILVNACG
jgi:aspartate-semialdehyde dehydrogenase